MGAQEAAWRILLLSLAVMWSYCIFTERIFEFSGIQHQRRGDMYKGSTPCKPMKDIPHVDECERCSECLEGNNMDKGHFPCDSSKTQGDLFEDAMHPNGKETRRLSHCKICYGCSHTFLDTDRETHAFNSSFVHTTGKSGAWIFGIKSQSDPSSSQATANHPSRVSVTGNTIVKLWCLSFHQTLFKPLLISPSTFAQPIKNANHNRLIRDQRGANSRRDDCNENSAQATMQMAMAMRRIAVECGMEGIVPEAWVAPVKGVMPKTGLPIDTDALFQTAAKGISLASLIRSASNPEIVLDILLKRVNRKQVVMAAIFDLLTSQCDRNPGNVFVSEDGEISLIDNTDGLGHGLSCSKEHTLSSLFLPSTGEYTYLALGKTYAKSGVERLRRTTPSPLVVMDYRCHAPNGEIGKQFSPQVRKCLNRFSSLEAVDLVEFLGLQSHEMGVNLKERAHDLLMKGFEWTLQNGRQQSHDLRRYSSQPPCCKMHKARGFIPSQQLQCAEQFTPAPLLQAIEL